MVRRKDEALMSDLWIKNKANNYWIQQFKTF